MKLFRKLAAVLLAVSLLLTNAAAYYEAFDHPDVSFPEMVYDGIVLDAVDDFCARFARDPITLYPELVALYDQLYTQNELAYIQMCQNPGNEAIADEAGRAADAFAAASDRIYTALGEALTGSQATALAALMPEGQSDGFSGYEPLSDEVSAAMNAEYELVRKYYLLP